MLKFVIIPLYFNAVLCNSILFPDQLAARASSEAVASSGDLNGHRCVHCGKFAPGRNGYYDYPHRYYPGTSGSRSEANAQSSGYGSQSNAQSEAQSYGGGSSSNAQAQANSQGYPYGGGYGGSSASSAASASSGFVDGVASAAASAAAASSGSGSSSSSASASSSGSNNNGRYGYGPNGYPSWLLSGRIGGDDVKAAAGSTSKAAGSTSKAAARAAGGIINGKLVFSEA